VRVAILFLTFALVFTQWHSHSGTSIVFVSTPKGLVLAADSLQTGASVIQTQKINICGRYVLCGSYGLGDITARDGRDGTQRLYSGVEILQETHTEKNVLPGDVASSIYRNLTRHQVIFDQYVRLGGGGRQIGFNPLVAFIVAGYNGNTVEVYRVRADTNWQSLSVTVFKPELITSFDKDSKSIVLPIGIHSQSDALVNDDQVRMRYREVFAENMPAVRKVVSSEFSEMACEAATRIKLEAAREPSKVGGHVWVATLSRSTPPELSRVE
jgi:hypothetical protein